MALRLLALLVALLGIPGVPAHAQLISVRSVPVPRHHQFDLFPSFNVAMGDLAIAVDDSLRDPFVNPARGAMIRGKQVFLSPGFDRVLGSTGQGSSLPIGGLFSFGAWFAAVGVAVQDVDAEWVGGSLPVACQGCLDRGFLLSASHPSRRNKYLTASVGRQFVEQELAVGFRLQVSDLQWVHGVDLLYAGSYRIEHRGDQLDARLGMTKWWGGRTLDAVVLHNRFKASHDVVFPEVRAGALVPRLETNGDQTEVWGAHLRYRQPLPDTRWHIGAIATSNLMWHPKIPNYVLQNIPRDPGNTSAFNLGLGLWNNGPRSDAGIEFVFEPVRSHTWGEAETDVPSAGGGVIPAGGRTVDNRFRFHNVVIRAGSAHRIPLGTDGSLATVRFGLSAYSVNYDLEQRNYLSGVDRSQQERWVEWTPSWGVTLRLGRVDLHYRGRVTATRLGNLFDFGLIDGGDDVTVLDPPGVIAAPSTKLAMDGLRVTSHRLAVVLALP